MSMLWTVLACVFDLVSFVSFIFIVVAAFRDEVWKGLLCLVCGIYTLYYIIFENFNAGDLPVPLGLIWLGSGVIGAGLMALARHS